MVKDSTLTIFASGCGLLWIGCIGCLAYALYKMPPIEPHNDPVFRRIYAGCPALNAFSECDSDSDSDSD